MEISDHVGEIAILNVENAACAVEIAILNVETAARAVQIAILNVETAARAVENSIHIVKNSNPNLETPTRSGAVGREKPFAAACSPVRHAVTACLMS